MRDFIDMDDFLGLVDLALAEDAPTGIYNVSTGTGHSIRDIFRRVSIGVGTDPEADVPEVDPGADDVAAVVLDPAKTISAFKWRPRYSFNEIIDRMVAWYDKHGVTAIYSHLRKPDLSAGD